jgi:hypothetical protein
MATSAMPVRWTRLHGDGTCQSSTQHAMPQPLNLHRGLFLGTMGERGRELACFRRLVRQTHHSQHGFFFRFSSSIGSENIHGQVGGIVPPHGHSQMLSLETTGAKLSMTHHHQSLDTSRRPDSSSLPTHQEESAGTPSRIPASASRCVVSSIAHATAPFTKIATAPILDRA